MKPAFGAPFDDAGSKSNCNASDRCGAAAPFRIDTPRLILRSWRDADREPFARMNADPDVMAYFAAPMTPEESDQAILRYQSACEATGIGFVAVEDRASGIFLGTLGAQTMRDIVPNLPQPAIEIGWRLTREAWGRGFATEGARSIVDLAFQELQRAELVAVTALGNRASRRVMEKLGMTHRPDLDFDHPRMPVGHPHRRHTLYHLQAHGV